MAALLTVRRVAVVLAAVVSVAPLSATAADTPPVDDPLTVRYGNPAATFLAEAHDAYQLVALLESKKVPVPAPHEEPARSTVGPAPADTTINETDETLAVTEPPASNVDGGVWDQLAECESGGNWSIDTGNGYYGGLQFLDSTWDALGTGYDRADQAPKSVQIDAAQRLQAEAGWGQWPTCASKLGLR
jgi:Transglycosylase-like domain